jgi:hypothetical protein
MDQDFRKDLEYFRILLKREADKRSLNLSLKTAERKTGEEYVRTLESIGRRISSEKPPCPKTVRKLIRLHGLPAVKHDMGWMVRAQDLEDWKVRMFTHEDE